MYQNNPKPGQQNGQNSGGQVWPGQPTQGLWPGQPTQGLWPGQLNQPQQPAWPGQPNQPQQPTWPGQPTQPQQPAWPGQPTQPQQPAWPGQPTQPQQPAWPGQPTQPQQPVWPGQPTQPQQPAWPGQPTQPQQPAWPGQPTQPQQPAWPGQPTQPQQPAWPSQPTQPQQPAWPGQPSQPTAPSWPGQNPPTPPQQSPLKVPHDMKLQNGICDKMLITIKGQIKPNPNKFTINLTRGKDIAFHFNPRFNESGKKVIVRNSLLGGRWGREERALNRFPFTPGEPFELKILCTHDEFKVAVDKSHLLEYKHRIRELNTITSMSIYDDITLTSVNVDKLP